VLANKSLDLVPERYEGYRVEAVRTLRNVLNAQASESDTKRQTEVLAAISALAAMVSRNGAEAAQ
jgi:hypothetical protein